MNIDIELNCDGIDVSASGNVFFGTSDYFDHALGNWHPGDPGRVDDLTVTLHGEEKIDITGLLTAKQCDKIEAILFEEASKLK